VALAAVVGADEHAAALVAAELGVALGRAVGVDAVQEGCVQLLPVAVAEGGGALADGAERVGVGLVAGAPVALPRRVAAQHPAWVERQRRVRRVVGRLRSETVEDCRQRVCVLAQRVVARKVRAGVGARKKVDVRLEQFFCEVPGQ
jgi:hypothetical protein